MQHFHHLFYDFMPESQMAIDHVAKFVTKHIPDSLAHKPYKFRDPTPEEKKVIDFFGLNNDDPDTEEEAKLRAAKPKLGTKEHLDDTTDEEDMLAPTRYDRYPVDRDTIDFILSVDPEEFDLMHETLDPMEIFRDHPDSQVSDDSTGSSEKEDDEEAEKEVDQGEEEAEEAGTGGMSELEELEELDGMEEADEADEEDETAARNWFTARN